jgi:hypothetical protein
LKLVVDGATVVPSEEKTDPPLAVDVVPVATLEIKDVLVNVRCAIDTLGVREIAPPVLATFVRKIVSVTARLRALVRCNAPAAAAVLFSNVHPRTDTAPSGAFGVMCNATAPPAAFAVLDTNDVFSKVAELKPLTKTAPPPVAVPIAWLSMHMQSFMASTES